MYTTIDQSTQWHAFILLLSLVQYSPYLAIKTDVIRETLERNVCAKLDENFNNLKIPTILEQFSRKEYFAQILNYNKAILNLLRTHKKIKNTHGSGITAECERNC